MTNATAAGRPRFLLSPAATRPAHRYAGRLGALCSPAGMHPTRGLMLLRRALDRRALVLHYQPIVTLRTGVVSHYEALVRVPDGRGGRLLTPGHFLPAAERYGLIFELDRMVVADAVAALGKGSHRVAVNVSALSITDPGMLAHIAGQLGTHNVDPGRLVIEITETAAISDMRVAKEFCAELRAMGCGVALDDIGAGFGSFYYLKHLPFDYLKIDGHFVRSLPGSINDELVVKALVSVAQGMGTQTIAEFVGDMPTVELLRDFGVDHAQGFALGRPAAGIGAPVGSIAPAASTGH